MSESISIRPAVEADAPLILRFIRELASYENLPHEVEANEQKIHDSFFGSNPGVYSLLAFVGGLPAGFAIYFFTYSTFAAAPVLYLEDVFVSPEFRRRGVGRRFFVELNRLAIKKGCCRFEFVVLDWNKPAHQFYESIGAHPRAEWVRFRMARAAMDKLAQE